MNALHPVTMLRSRDAAAFLGISPRHLTTLVGKSRRAIAYYKMGRERLFKIADLERYRERCRVAAMGE